MSGRCRDYCSLCWTAPLRCHSRTPSRERSCFSSRSPKSTVLEPSPSHLFPAMHQRRFRTTRKEEENRRRRRVMGEMDLLGFYAAAASNLWWEIWRVRRGRRLIIHIYSETLGQCSAWPEGYIFSRYYVYALIFLMTIIPFLNPKCLTMWICLSMFTNA